MKLLYNTNIEKFYEITGKCVDVILNMINANIIYNYDEFVGDLMESVKVYGYIPYSKEHYENYIKNDKRIIIRNNMIFLNKYVSLNIKLKEIIRYPDKINDIKETFNKKELKYYKMLRKIYKNQNWFDINGGDINFETLIFLFDDLKSVMKVNCRKCPKNIKIICNMFFSKLYYKINDKSIYLIENLTLKS